MFLAPELHTQTVRNPPTLFRRAIRVSGAAEALAILALASPPSTPPGPGELLKQSEALVARSVVRIERRTYYRDRRGEHCMVNHGTGVMIGTQAVGKRREYLVLSDEHVADNSHVKGKTALRIVAADGNSTSILLEILWVDRKRDQALLRTVLCEQEFRLPQYVVGAPGNLKRDMAFTEGYGNGRFAIVESKILSTDAESWGLRCYTLGAPVGAGQSGGPMVAIGADRHLYLVALVFCGDDRFTQGTPLSMDTGILRHLGNLTNAQLAITPGTAR